MSVDVLSFHNDPHHDTSRPQKPQFMVFFLGPMVNLISALNPISAECSVIHGASVFNVQRSCADKNMVGDALMGVASGISGG